MESRFGKENEAIKAIAQLMADAQTCRRLYEEAGLPLPRPLIALFDLEESPDRGNANPPEVVIPPPPRPARAPRGSTEWIYLPLEDAQETSLVLAVLLPNMAIVQPEIVKRVQSYRPQVNTGTIANIVSRLAKQNIIRRVYSGWLLSDIKYTTEITDNYIWGAPRVFRAQELASYRRMVILHVLKSYPDGLQVAQLSRVLDTRCPWLNEALPVTKVHVKADIEALADIGLVRRIGGSSNWGLAQ